MIFEREIVSKIQQFIQQFKVVSLTGPRQSGKTTLLRNLFPDYTYINLENSDMKLWANTDPNGFLDRFNNKIIIDEAQEAPELFSNIQVKVDESSESGQYILSGSQNFLLMEKITQSLAGRVGIMRIFPLTITELNQNNILPQNYNELIFRGGYPLLYTLPDASVPDFYDSYVNTYVERDVRQLQNIENIATFRRFVQLCAGRVGQELNINALAVEASISAQTVKRWLSILETSYLIFQIQPFYKNFNKRITKSPKLYFYDTGLACNLLNISSSEQLDSFYMRGALFENLIIAELQKRTAHQNFRAQLNFWRENNGIEIDLLIEENLQIRAVEIKSGKTITSDFIKNFRYFQKYSKDDIAKYQVIYGGDLNARANDVEYISWKRV